MIARLLLLLCTTATLATPALAAKPDPQPAADVPVSILPPSMKPDASVPAKPTVVTPPPVITPVTPPPVLPPPPPPVWSLSDAKALVAAINAVDKEGLFPADYLTDDLTAAIEAGESDTLNAVATRQFGRLAGDLRDGRTPFAARTQWYVRDPDAKAMPTDALLAAALAAHDIPGALAKLNPTSSDYAALKSALAATPASETARKALIRVNMERWRWLPRDLGFKYVMANVPEMQLRFMVNTKLVRSYKAVVGKPGETETPQLFEQIEAVIFNPTWTVPQSIIKKELTGLSGVKGTSGKFGKYTWTRSAGGGLTVVQPAGPNNALGLMKLVMPNPHAIYIHDTPSRERFNQENRALSHGCVRAERASELGLTLAILQADLPAEEGVSIIKAGKTKKVDFKQKMPVYIAYFTLATGLDGKLQPFADIYGRDKPVVASLAAPRVDKAVGDFQAAPVVAVKDPGI
jgi:L,D-transpeptidase YcbB